MVYRDREFVEDIGSSTVFRMSDMASLGDYSPNSKEGWILKALSSQGPSSLSNIDRWVTRNGGPRDLIDSAWTMSDEGSLEIVN